MTQYDKIASMSMKEMLQWLDEAGDCGDSPWLAWFEAKYCSQCANDPKPPCAKFGKSCKFFKRCPSDEDIMEMWLSSEIKEN